MQTAAPSHYARTLFTLCLVLAGWIPSALGEDQQQLVLEYYMHLEPGLNYVGISPPYDNSTTDFGLVSAMDLPLTVAPDPNSTRLGAERCMSINLSQYPNPSYMSDMHMCIVIYDDGVYSGVFNTMGDYNLMQPSGMEYGVAGGAGHFRGVQGYVVGTLHSNISSHTVYHFSAHLRLPDPPTLSRNIVNPPFY